MKSASWHAAALEDYQHSGMSFDALAKKYGRSRDTLIKLVKTHDVQRCTPLARPGRGKMLDLEPLSEVHKYIGVRINYYRTVQNNWQYKELGQLIHASWWLLRKMEQGSHDFTLTEIKQISDLLGVPVDELLSPPQIVSSADGESWSLTR